MDKTFCTVTTIRGRLADSQPFPSKYCHVIALVAQGETGLSALWLGAQTSEV